MARMTADQIYAVLRRNGADPQHAVTFTAIALRESGGDPSAHNGNAATNDNSYGLFQENIIGALARNRPPASVLLTPDGAAQGAIQLWGGNDANLQTHWRINTPGIYQDGYLRNLPAAVAAATKAGEWGAAQGADLTRINGATLGGPMPGLGGTGGPMFGGLGGVGSAIGTGLDFAKNPLGAIGGAIGGAASDAASSAFSGAFNAMKPFLLGALFLAGAFALVAIGGYRATAESRQQFGQQAAPLAAAVGG